MFESLFGAETPLAVRFFIAFVVVFALIGAAAWLVRRFGAARLGGQAARGRQPRLAVIEAGAVDGRRKLVLVRRDNVEHLIMIGGPSDIVIEPNIIRGQSARETATARDASWTEPAPRTARTTIADEPSWSETEPHVPMPAQVTAAPPPPRRPARPAATPAPAIPAADPLAGLAAELSTREPEVLRAPPASGDGARRTAPSLDGVRPGDAGAPRRAEPAAPRAPEPTPMLDSLRDKQAAAPDPLVAMIAGAPPAAPRAPADANLAEMAHRLEAALRRSPASDKRPAKAAGAASAAPSAGGHPDHPPAPERAKADGEKTAEHAPATAPEQSPFSSLEEEMANLLGRPPGKG